MKVRLGLRAFRHAIRSSGPRLGVWACATIWISVAPAFLSLLGTLQWKAFPFSESDRIVQVNAGFDLIPLLATSGQFQAVSSYDGGWVVVEGPRGGTSVIGAAVDQDFFSVLAVRPRFGRVFAHGSTPSDTTGAVLTESLYRRLFGSVVTLDHAAFRVAGQTLVVLGVVPDRPIYPPGTELWFLRQSGIRPDSAFLSPDTPRSGIVGRLSSAVSVRLVDANVQILAREAEKRSKIHQGDVEVVSLEDLLRRRSQGERGILSVALAGLLGFAFLAYASALSSFILGREKEFTVRIALGARRSDLARLLLRESLLLAVPGFLTGIPISFFVLSKLKGLVPFAVAEMIPPSLDVTSLSIAIAGFIAIGIMSVSGVWLSAPQIGLSSVLVPERSETRQTRPQARIRLAFVGAALGLAVTLGSVAAMLRQSLDNLQRESLGFEPRNAISAVVRFPEPIAAGSLTAVLAQTAERIGAIPGVRAVSFSDHLPFGDSGSFLEISTPNRSESWLARCQKITGDYLSSMGIRLVAGRGLDSIEQATGAPVALLDEEGAHKVFAGSSPLGGIILLQGKPLEVVGIVASTRASSPDDKRRPQIYLPLLFEHGKSGPSALALLARLSGPVAEREMSAAVRGAGASLSQYRSLSENVAAMLSARQLARDLAIFQFGSALILVALATFATFSWLYEVRAHELVVRFALGETRVGMARHMLRSVLQLIVIAILVGLLLYIPAGKALRSLIFGVDVLSFPALLEAIAAISAAALSTAAVATGLALKSLSSDLLFHRDMGRGWGR